MAVRIWLVLTITLLFGAAQARAGSAAPYAGIYVVAIPNVNGSATNLAQAASYREAFVDGVLIPLHWSFIEPAAPHQVLAKGAGVINPLTGEVFCPFGTTGTNFCWQELDEQLALIGPGKKLSLALIAGGFAPAWLRAAPYQVSATPPVLYASHGGTGPNCFDINLPLVSSAANGNGRAPSSFAAQYVATMQAIAAHLSSKGVLGQVAIIKIGGGINTVTQEFHLDASTTTGPCLGNATVLWAQLGYTPTPTLQVWEYLAQHVAAVFPAALPSLDILENSLTAAPLITDGGVVFTAAQYLANPSAYGPLLLDRALGALVPGAGVSGILGSAAVAVQWNGLAPADQQSLPSIAPHTLAAGANGAVIGWQSNEMFAAEGASCGTAACASATTMSTPCYGTVSCVAEFGSLLENGLMPVPGSKLAPAFIEVWAPDVVNPCLQPALVAAHNVLTHGKLGDAPGC